MDTFLHILDQTRFNQEFIKHLNTPMTSDELKTVIKTLSTNKSPETDGFITKFTRPSKQN
jgi:arsenate reductase-like glutaredoxin family protein